MIKMKFTESIFKPPYTSELKGMRIIYTDGYYELMGYYEFNEQVMEDKEVKDEVKTMLMDIFTKLQNSERRILRKHNVDARGKLNYKNFNHA